MKPENKLSYLTHSRSFNHALQAIRVESEQGRLFGQVVPMNPKETDFYAVIHMVIDHLHEQGFDPKQKFEYPDYGGLNKRIVIQLKPEPVLAVQEALKEIAGMENPTRDQCLIVAIRRAAALGFVPSPDGSTSTPSVSPPKMK